MSSAVKWLALLAFCFAPHLYARQLYILVVGQSVAANCNEHRYAPVKGVFQIGLNGQEVAAADPFEWADCNRGATWIPLGRRLIESGMADRVTFMPIGVNGSTVADWSAGGKADAKLTKALALIKQKGLVFDYAFWQQGPADANIRAPRYTKILNSVLYRLSTSANIKNWLIATHSTCHGRTAPHIAKAQQFVNSYHLLNRFPGPNTDLLGESLRFDGCNLNQAGQEQMAQSWLESIRAAEQTRTEVHRESMLDLFN
jgi:hypothetical protein